MPATDLLHERVQAVRDHFHGDGSKPGDGIPMNWTPEQWVAAVNIQLGSAATSLHSQLFRDRQRDGIDPADLAEGIEHLVAVAAIAMDAVTALESTE